LDWLERGIGRGYMNCPALSGRDPSGENPRQSRFLDTRQSAEKWHILT